MSVPVQALMIFLAIIVSALFAQFASSPGCVIGPLLFMVMFTFGVAVGAKGGV